MNNPTVNTTTPNNLTTLLVQNPDLLLSCASIEDRGLQHHHLSHLDPNNETNSSNNNHMTTMTSSSNPSELIIPDVVVEMDAATATASCPIRQFSFDQFIQQEEVSLEQQQEIKEEILDFNIFDLLQNEEPEMARLIDQASSSFDTILGSPSSLNYLPQISVNTTTKVLDNLVAAHHHHMGMPKTLSNSSLSSMLLELSRASGNEIDLSSNGQKQAPVLFKLDDEMPSTSGGSMHPSSSFKELCDLLSISKQKTTTTLTKLKLTDDTLPSTSSAASLKPSRSSMRLIQKRGIKKEPMDVEEETPKRRNTSTTSRRNSKKLPYSDSEDSDDKSSTTDSPSDSPKPATNLNSSNENSMDLSTFYTPNDQSDEDEDDDDDIESDDSSSMGGVMKRSSRSGRKNGLHPIKKESNKEAATRYRLKKISEKDKLFETRFNLEKENDSKRRQIELVQTEINYLKTILVQFILTKSCITNNNNTNNPTAV